MINRDDRRLLKEMHIDWKHDSVDAEFERQQTMRSMNEAVLRNVQQFRCDDMQPEMMGHEEALANLRQALFSLCNVQQENAELKERMQDMADAHQRGFGNLSILAAVMTIVAIRCAIGWWLA